jgi:hypothetical protein
MAPIEGVRRDIADLRIEQIGLCRIVRAVLRSTRDHAAGQQLMPVDDLVDTVAATAIPKYTRFFVTPAEYTS